MAELQEGKKPVYPLFGVRGRNGEDPVFSVRDGQVVEALNVDFFQSSLARKRGGAASVSITGGTAFTTGIARMGVFEPTSDPGAVELWATDFAGTPLTKRLAGGTSWANVTFVDAISARPQDICYQSFNQKMYAAFDSTVNRLHCYDPSDGSPSMRRVGFAKPAAPTTGVSGGAVTDSRKYRVAWTKQSGGITIKRSNLSDASAVVSPAAQTVTVTRPSLAAEDETHWELYAYTLTNNYSVGYLIATTASGTATATDNNAVLSGSSPPDENANTPFPSVKFLVADDSRLVGAGGYETSAGDSIATRSNMVVWSPPLGASNIGDDERVSNTTDIKGYDFVDQAIMGISQPIQGTFRVFSLRAQWKYVATGVAEAPYTRFRVTGGSGCVDHASIVVAEDQNGDPSLYWASPKGPVRESQGGQQRMDHDIRDIWRTVNKDATGRIAHAVYHEDKSQIWFYIATGSSNYPDKKLCFDTRYGHPANDIVGTRDGWTLHTGPSCSAYCSIMFSETIAASMSRTQKPYAGYTGSLALYRADTSATDDAGTAFQAYVETKPLAPWGLSSRGSEREEPTLIAVAGSGVTITLTVTPDEGLIAAHASTVSLTPEASETAVFRKFDDCKFSVVHCVRLRLGDAAAVSNTWNLHALMAPFTVDGTQ